MSSRGGTPNFRAYSRLNWLVAYSPLDQGVTGARYWVRRASAPGSPWLGAVGVLIFADHAEALAARGPS